MAWTGTPPNQTYVREDGVRSGAAICVTAKANGVNDTAVLADARENDFATAINLTWKRDGGNQPVANLPMNGFKFTGVGAATAADQYVTASQAQASSLIYGGTAGGTANALTLDLTPSITGYAAGQHFLFKALADNTSVDVTANVDAVGAATVFKHDGATKPAIGEIQAGGMYLLAQDGTNFCLIGGLSPNVVAFAALTGAADKLAYFTGAGAMSLADFSAFARTLLDDANAAAMRTTLGLVIGTDVQAFDAELAALAGLTSAADRLPYFTGSGTAALATFTAAGRALVDDATAAAQRTTLAVSGAAVQRAYTETASFTTSNNIPADGTVPQITEGDQVLTQAITPTSASNRIRVTFQGTFELGTGTVGNRAAVALFNGAASAVAIAAQAYDDNAHPVHVGLVYEQVAGTTSPITFSIRGGATTGTQLLSAEYGTSIPRAAMVVEEINV